MSLPRSVGFSVKVLANQIQRFIYSNSNLKEDMGSLTEMQFRVIIYVSYHSKQDVFQRDIENEFKIRRSTATKVLQLMEKKGLLKREPVAYDARLKKLVLTEKTINIKPKVDVMSELEKKMLAGLAEEEVDNFFRIIDKITKNIE